MKIIGNIGILCWMELFIALTRSLVEAQELPPPSADFERHSIVRPLLLHKRTKIEILTTRDTDGLHHLEVTLKVPIDGDEYILDLRLNQDLVPDNHVLSYQENGKTVLHKPTTEEMDLCHYGGSVRGRPGSWVAVSTCDGVQGVVFDGERMRYIEPAQGGGVNTDHYMYDHSDLTATRRRRRCGKQATNYTRHYSYEGRRTRHERGASDEKVLNESYQENESSLYVELVLVADNRHFEAHHRDRHSVHREMKAVANILNSLYSSLNIFIVLVGVVVWNDHDLIAFEKNSSIILKNFNRYRTTTLLKDIRHDNAHLVTHQEFEGNVVGLAYVDTMCTFGLSCGIAHYGKVIGDLAWTIAHEMGHNFGMWHDAKGADCECPRKSCIMGAKGLGGDGWKRTSTSFMPSHWSSCSLNSLALSISKGMDSCLRNKPKRLLDSATCGNGVVEAGEQCDCGTPSKDVYNPCHACCDPNTCMPRANATCSAGRCCDLQTCRPKSAGTECRGAERECDLPEYCSGHSAHCPEDVHKMDTTPCGRDGESAYCVQGGCRSHSDQCRVLWGSTAKSCASFYNSNLKGDSWGDCGYDRLNQVHTRCAPADVMCGRLHCMHQPESKGLLVGSGDGTSSITGDNGGRTVKCHTTSIDLGLDVVDFGLVPDGAKCGEEMMCLKQRCVSVAAVRERIAHYNSSVCPSNCSGHGVCNSKGHCHCDSGFAPPLCALPGPGGSYDSGPATDQTILTRFTVAMYAIFLGIVPAIALVLLITYCWHQNAIEAWKKYKQKPILKPTDRISCMAGNDSPIYGTAVAACRVFTIYANIEEISSQKIRNQKTTAQELPLKGYSNSHVINSRDSQVQSKAKPTPNINQQETNYATVKIKPRPLVKSNKLVSEVVNTLKMKPLVIVGPNSNSLAGKIQANAEVDNCGALKMSKFNKLESKIEHNSQLANTNALQIKSLTKLKQNSKNLVSELQANDQVATTDTLKIKPVMKPKPNSKNLASELQANDQVVSTDALKIKTVMKPKPNSKNLASKLQANDQVVSTDALKVKPVMKPMPNSKNLASKLQTNDQFVSTDALRIKPVMKPKPNFINLVSELQANDQVVSTDAVKIKPVMKPKPNSKSLTSELQAKDQVISTDALKIKPVMTLKPNSKNLASELQTNTQADNTNALKIKTLENPESNINNLAIEFQANAQADNSETLKIKPLLKPKPKSNH